MKRWECVAIVGVGLIGGSIGLALRQRGLARRIVGIGRRRSRLHKAKQRGAITDTTTQFGRGVIDAELVIVCTPVERVVDHVCQVAEACREGTLITDAGSTKEQIVTGVERRLDDEAKRRVAFVGSHPMAGSQLSGVQHARADLFVDRVAIVTPSRRTRDADRESVEDFWRSLGARVHRCSPRSHDKAVAAVSHLPHVVAAALAAATPTEDLPLAGSGWQDTTRIAAADVDLWRQILNDNRSHVLKSLDKFAKVLSAFRQALHQDDQAKLVKLLAAGKHHRDAVGN
jgi:prephenate dehydrogenase